MINYNSYEFYSDKMEIIEWIKSFVLYTTYDDISLNDDLNIIYNNDNSTKITTLFTDYIEYCECNKTRYYSGEYEKINSNDLKIILNSLLKLFFLSPHITNRYINKNYKTEKEYNHFRNFIRFIYTNMNKPNQYIFYLMEKFPDYKLYKAKKFNL
jgi:hypothetical protein